MYKLCVFIPMSHLEPVKTALFEAGAGNLRHYSHCCWQTEGQGQFMPLDGSQPYIGEINQLEIVNEMKVELVVPDDKIKQVISAMKRAHPYETPAYDVWVLAEY